MNEDLFGSIKQTITETAGAVGKKTEEFVETQKMRNKDKIPNFFTDNYDHPIYECGVQLIDMVYLQRCL